MMHTATNSFYKLSLFISRLLYNVITLYYITFRVHFVQITPNVRCAYISLFKLSIGTRSLFRWKDLFYIKHFKPLHQFKGQ